MEAIRATPPQVIEFPAGVATAKSTMGPSETPDVQNAFPHTRAQILMSGTTWLRIGTVLGALAVTAGAFGAHGLTPDIKILNAMTPEGREAVAKKLANFETGARYHMYHALAIVALGVVTLRSPRPSGLLDIAGWMMLFGIFFFSGPLYGIGLGGPKWLGAFAPIGGVLLILGWVVFAFGTGEIARPETGRDGL